MQNISFKLNSLFANFIMFQKQRFQLAYKNTFILTNIMFSSVGFNHHVDQLVVVQKNEKRN